MLITRLRMSWGVDIRRQGHIHSITESYNSKQSLLQICVACCVFTRVKRQDKTINGGMDYNKMLNSFYRIRRNRKTKPRKRV